jgi:uncharacterized BrkB/YihY/UPF0761 family membrane protein
MSDNIGVIIAALFVYIVWALLIGGASIYWEYLYERKGFKKKTTNDLRRGNAEKMGDGLRQGETE